jgi:hypothetical protein
VWDDDDSDAKEAMRQEVIPGVWIPRDSSDDEPEEGPP